MGGGCCLNAAELGAWAGRGGAPTSPAPPGGFPPRSAAIDAAPSDSPVCVDATAAAWCTAAAADSPPREAAAPGGGAAKLPPRTASGKSAAPGFRSSFWRSKNLEHTEATT